jgi:FAD/FMN-containing dehydrogenase
LLSAEVITADGRRLRASAQENSDLFWGLRGGGGNFGIAASFKFQLYPVGPVVWGGAVFYPIDQAKELLRFYREWTPTLPQELTSMVAFLTAPPEPFVPKDLVGTPMVAVALCYIGDNEHGKALVQPLRDALPPAIDLVGPLPYTAMQGMFDATAPTGIRSYWKSEYLKDIRDEAIDTIIAQARAVRSPFTAIHIQHLEGAIGKVPVDETAFTHREASYVLNIVGEWMDPAADEANIQWVRGLWQAVQPFSTGAVYLNFMDNNEGEGRIRAAYGPQKYARLAQLKKKYDPTNLFHLNQNIKPES